jgi:hypothetical protein
MPSAAASSSRRPQRTEAPYQDRIERLRRWKRILKKLLFLIHRLTLEAEVQETNKALKTRFWEISEVVLDTRSTPETPTTMYPVASENCRHLEPGAVKEYAAGRHGKHRECQHCGSRWNKAPEATRWVAQPPRPYPEGPLPRRDRQAAVGEPPSSSAARSSRSSGPAARKASAPSPPNAATPAATAVDTRAEA